MAIYDLTNQPISSSFEPLLQIDSGSALRDGTGSLVDNIIVTASYALTASFAENVVPTDTGSLLTTASFDNGTRNLTFTKGDSSTFSVNIPDVSGSVLPSGVVSGSSQIILTDTSGNLGGNRITGSVANATNTRYVNVQPNAINSNYFPSFTNGTGLNTTVYIDTTGYTYNPGQNRLTISNVSATSVTASVSVTSPTFFGDLDGNALTATNATYSQNTITTGKNLHSSEILKGTPLYFTGSGTSGNIVGVYPADAGNPSRMPAGGVAGETIAVGAEGVVLLDGYIGNVDTSLFQSGDEVFVAVGGGYTNVAPTGSALIQHLGNVEKSAVNGSGVIQMMGEARGLPNLTSGYAWVGDVNGVPQAVATSSFAVSIDTGSLVTTSSFNAYTQSNDSKVNNLINATGSYATTGSNTFIGNQTITGSVFVSSSIESNKSKSNVIYNPQTVIDTVNVPTEQNGFVVGPVTISGDFTVEGNSNLYFYEPTSLDPYVTYTAFNTYTGSAPTLGANTFTGRQTMPSITVSGDIVPNYIFGSTSISSSVSPISITAPAGGGSQTGLSISGRVDLNGNLFGNQVIQGSSAFFGNYYGFNQPVGMNSNFGWIFKGESGQDTTVTVSGSINIKDTINLAQQDPLPTGSVGDIATSGSALYFHDGTNWRTVNLT